MRNPEKNMKTEDEPVLDDERELEEDRIESVTVKQISVLFKRKETFDAKDDGGNIEGGWMFDRDNSNKNEAVVYKDTEKGLYMRHVPFSEFLDINKEKILAKLLKFKEPAMKHSKEMKEREAIFEGVEPEKEPFEEKLDEGLSEQAEKSKKAVAEAVKKYKDGVKAKKESEKVKEPEVEVENRMEPPAPLRKRGRPKKETIKEIPPEAPIKEEGREEKLEEKRKEIEQIFENKTEPTTVAEKLAEKEKEKKDLEETIAELEINLEKALRDHAERLDKAPSAISRAVNFFFRDEKTEKEQNEALLAVAEADKLIDYLRKEMDDAKEREFELEDEIYELRENK